jgi:hypothetical protein
MKFDISNIGDYDIMSALRGPDASTSAATHAKHLTTSVLRNLAGMERNDRCVIFTPDEAAREWEMAPLHEKLAVLDFMNSNYHFESHFRRALNVMATRGVPGVAAYKKWYFDNIDGPARVREALAMSV